MSLGGQLRQRGTLQPAPRLRDEGARARSRTLGDAERDSWIVKGVTHTRRDSVGLYFIYIPPKNRHG